jgi:hypothetical protein
LRAASFFVFGLGAGAFKFEPVARLYFLRPFAVKPPPRATDSFSPRPTLKLGPLLRFLVIAHNHLTTTLRTRTHSIKRQATMHFLEIHVPVIALSVIAALKLFHPSNSHTSSQLSNTQHTPSEPFERLIYAPTAHKTLSKEKLDYPPSCSSPDCKSGR